MGEAPAAVTLSRKKQTRKPKEYGRNAVARPPARSSGFFPVLPLNTWTGNRIKADALAGYDCPKSEGPAKENRLQDKMQKRRTDTMPVHQSVFLSSTNDLFHITGVCKHFYAVQSRHMLFWLLKDA